ncbi:MAG TPA: selenium-binding protein SBP56-related protein, partial [Pyrinomonadaceae bacterium]|nr:selenium-binding protein SBP56-related protein [Pyrinomonadaceae bacterium]
MRLCLTLLIFILSASTFVFAQSSSDYLFVWAADGDDKDSDFLAVVDARPRSKGYGSIIATLPVGVLDTSPHHVEYEFPRNARLFANGWGAGQTFIIDLSDPKKPKLAGNFKERSDYAFPHSFARLPNGNILATFQVKKNGYEPPGALVELDSQGNLIKATSADVVGMDKNQLWPYSLLALPDRDRVITTSTEMGLPRWARATDHAGSHDSHVYTDTSNFQVWRLSDLRLLATVSLPAQPGGRSNLNPAEPRLLQDGSVYINTFNCGLFRVSDIDGAAPKAEHVYDFPGATTKEECGVPVVVGRYWIQTDPSLPGLIALDTSDPAKPREVSRIVFDKRFEKPHWVAADRKADRLVVTGNQRSWVLIVNIDVKTGKLTLDEKFREKGSVHSGIDFDRSSWPHGASGKA